MHTIAMVAFALSCVIGAAKANRPPLTVPQRADTVLERLPAGYAGLANRATRMTPAQMIAEADRLLATAARTGDSRLAARADSLLARFPTTAAQPDLLRARAFGAQHRHDFTGAIILLDRLIAQQPRDGNARMARAQIQLVQGRLDLARGDCVALILGIDADDGMLCTAVLSMRRSTFGAAANMLDRWLAQAPSSDPRRGYALLLRAEVAGHAKAADADGWFRKALDADREDVRTLAAYARYLREIGRDREVEPLLADMDIDGLQLQRALAAQAADAPNASALADAQARRYDTAHAAGSQPEMRDEAAFLLTLRNRPADALALAQKNFESQRDFEDVDILVRAAQTAGRADALAPLRAWARSQQVPLPVSSSGAR